VCRDVGRECVLGRDQLVGEIHVQPAFDTASVELAAPSGLRPEDQHHWGHVGESGDYKALRPVERSDSGQLLPSADGQYLPVSRSSVPRLVVRAHGEPGALVQPVREVLQAFDPRQQVMAVFAREELRREMEMPRSLAALSLSVALVALGLAAIGLFGITAFIVERRTHELAVRRALGATHADLVTMLLRESLSPVVVGLFCGVLLSLAGGRVLQNVLYGASARDPLAIASAVVVLMAAASAAVLVPARRAHRSDPSQLLKLG
jgi:hypothetical protein